MTRPLKTPSAAAIRSFREELRRIAGATEIDPLRISLLYPLDNRGQRLSWAASETRLWAIAEECAARADATEFALDDPVVVAPDRDWTNIRNWKVVRSLYGRKR